MRRTTLSIFLPFSSEAFMEGLDQRRDRVIFRSLFFFFSSGTADRVGKPLSPSSPFFLAKLRDRVRDYRLPSPFSQTSKDDHVIIPLIPQQLDRVAGHVLFLLYSSFLFFLRPALSGEAHDELRLFFFLFWRMCF